MLAEPSQNAYVWIIPCKMCSSGRDPWGQTSDHRSSILKKMVRLVTVVLTPRRKEQGRVPCHWRLHGCVSIDAQHLWETTLVPACKRDFIVCCMWKMPPETGNLGQFPEMATPRLVCLWTIKKPITMYGCCLCYALSPHYCSKTKVFHLCTLGLFWTFLLLYWSVLAQPQILAL